MTVVERTDVTAAARLAAAAAGLVMLVAVVVRLTVAAAARHWLDFKFPGTTDSLGEVGQIFANNARLLFGVLVACMVAQVARPAPTATRAERIALRGLVGVCDAGLILATALHLAYVGTAIGAYGSRTLAAMWPHGPLEVSAFALALALYVTARRQTLERRRIVGVAIAAVTVLALAAVLEVFA